ncbi:calcium-binding protein [Metapseudomonas otitidis]|uniref:calcium-binding protein n=1 Tax=Metapseudomonas otitidis TaxID=319939 RepID=UPI0013F66D83|nr:calcium-binding protein [Pseudomonas otitidis]
MNSNFDAANSFIQRIDPLSLDLDGDGIETVGANAGITFDFDGDGLKTGTGWVKGDDGFLVLDRNGNGQIDNGSELFGVDTVKANGQKATDGFDALRDFDSNGDGVFDAKDAQFANVRIWQDSNQDGIAQAGELKTLAEHNIVAINLDSTASNQASNGNLISAIGSFVRGDGSEGTVNANQSLAANLDLASNPFYREFTDPIALDDAAKALPDMKGSGAVRNLREASMLNAELKTLLATYAQAQTREEQMGLLDKLIAEWAKSANYQTFDKRIDALDEGGTDVRFQYSWEAAGTAPTDAQKSTQQLLERIKALEVFNGQNFLRFGKVGATANGLTLSFGMGTTNGTTTYAIKDGSVVINEDRLGLNAGQAGLLNQAYEALKKSIYDGLLLQTRLKPYVDQIGLNITDTGIALDYSEMTKLFEQTAVTSPLKAFNDVLDLSLAWKGDTSSEVAFGQIAASTFEKLSDEDLQKARQRTEEAGYRFIFGDQSGNALTGSSGNDRIFGGAGNDILQGGKGVNQLYGGDGDDTLSNDVWYSDNNLYVGGKGNDVLNGTVYRDTYFFELGDGHDVINEVGGEDVLRFGADINSTDLWLQRTGNNLELSVLGSEDKVTISNWYASASNHVETIKTADGKTLLDSQVQNLVNAMAAFAPPTAGNANLTPEQRAQLEVVIAANWH